MKTRYKTGKFERAVSAGPGDLLYLTLTERHNNGRQITEKISEAITVSATLTHWVMFYIPGVGFGGLFGGPNIGEKMSEIFVEPELVADVDNLFA